MNESQFDKALRVSHCTPTASDSLDEVIDRALGKASSGIRMRRRLAMSFVASAVMVFGLIAFPAVKAQASINGIVNALDRATRVRITTYSVDEQGRRSLGATTTVADGDTWYRSGSGTMEAIDKGAHTYVFDSSIGAYFVQPRRPSRSLKLSAMLGSAGDLSLGKRADVQQVTFEGRSRLRAVITNGTLPERMIIEADPATELPTRAQTESLERGQWRVRQIHEFEYRTDLAVPGPDLKRYRVTTKDQADAEFSRAMEGKTLAEVQFNTGRLVIRALDVARDGTVFVAFQAGDRVPNCWRGFALDLSDSLGTRYIREQAGGDLQMGSTFPADGRVEEQIFVPVHPVSASVQRELVLKTHSGPRGNLVRMIQAGIQDSTGHISYHWQPNYFGSESGPATERIAMRQVIGQATCDESPSWIWRIDRSGFADPMAAELFKAGARSKAAMEDQRWADAEVLLHENLRLMREIERKGGSPWAQGKTLEDLDMVKSHLQTP